MQTLTVAQVRERVAGRYPEAEPLPDRPELDELLRAAGFEFAWDPAALGWGRVLRQPASRHDLRQQPQRVDLTGSNRDRAGHTQSEITPEEADARQFEERLQRSLKEGAFLTLLVTPVPRAGPRRAWRRFPVQLVDGDGLFIDGLRAVPTRRASTGTWSSDRRHAA